MTTPSILTRGNGPYRVVAYDFGIKEAMLRQLGDLATVTVVPAATPADAVLDLGPDGVFLSNGPGDPAALPGIIGEVRRLVDHGTVPIFGICLGHQLLASALGAVTYKLPFGHHGGNHPVRRETTGRVEITSQNHNYAVAADSLGATEVTHVNLNDGVIEGLRSTEVPAFSVQYHPEAGTRSPRCPVPVRAPTPSRNITTEEAALRRLRHQPRPAGVRPGQPARSGQGGPLRPVLPLAQEPAAPVPRRVRGRAGHLRRRHRGRHRRA